MQQTLSTYIQKYYVIRFKVQDITEHNISFHEYLEIEMHQFDYNVYFMVE